MYIAAPPEVIFAFLTDQEKFCDGWAFEQSATPEREEFFESIQTAATSFAERYLQVVPPFRVVFTWGSEEKGRRVPAGSTRVEIELTRGKRNAVAAHP